MRGGLEVRVEGQRVVRLMATPPVAAKVLPGPVLMLIGSSAALLTGDSVELRVDLAPGSSLTVRTTAATLAHPCDEGGSTALTVEARVGAGARLVWRPEPLIACRGCHHSGRVRLAISEGATVVWLDTVTLGRTGESPGWLEQRLDASLDGEPLLREGLRLGPGWDGPAVLGGYRHVANLHVLGRRLPPEATVAGAMQLAGLGTTVRLLAHRGDELARQLAAVMPFFLHPGTSGPRPQEAVHV